MLTKAKVAFAAALLIGSVSTALADETFDVNLYHPNPNAPAATQTYRTQFGNATSSFAQSNTRGAVRAPETRIQAFPTPKGVEPVNPARMN